MLLNAKKILIVDESQSTLHFVRHILASAGYRVYTASNVSQAIDLAEEYELDAVLTEINMSDEGGLELIRKLRRVDEYASIPILAVTLSNSAAIKEEGKQAGATGWVAKPISPPNLVNLLRKLLVTDNDLVYGAV